MNELRVLAVPPLPANLVPRPHAVDALCDKVLSNRLTAVEGIGGIGKTVLAQMLCRNEHIKKAFPDGIFWLTIGRESEIKPEMVCPTLLAALGGSVEYVWQAEDRYRSLMRDKAALLVLDSVWRAEEIQPWLADSVRSRFLFTTGDASVASTLGVEKHSAKPLNPVEARELLQLWARPDKASPPEGEELIAECAYLPQAVATVGALLRGKPPSFWKQTLDLLRSAEARAIAAQFPSPNENLVRALHVSVEQLDALHRNCYFALAVLLDEMPTASVIQQALWGMDAGKTGEVRESLIRLCLAQPYGESETIKLHGLQLDYARTRYPDPEALRIIRDAVRLSCIVIAKDPAQFVSQMVGRLMRIEDFPPALEFAARLKQHAPVPWLRPLWPSLKAPGGGWLRALDDGDDKVALSANGCVAVSAAYWDEMTVWEVSSGRMLRTIRVEENHFHELTCVALSGDGQLAVSVSEVGPLKVWEVKSGRLLRTLKGHAHLVTAVALSADGRLAISASYDKTLKVWEVETGRLLRTLTGHAGIVNHVALSGDRRLAVSASNDKTLKVWEVETGRLLRTLDGHTDRVVGVGLSGDGQLAISASYDTTLKAWEVESGRLLRTLETHAGAALAVAMSKDGRIAVSTTRSYRTLLWEVHSGRLLRTLEGHGSCSRSVALSEDGRIAVSAYGDESMDVWEVERGYRHRTLEGHGGPVTSVAVSGDGRQMVSASFDSTLKVWEVESGRLLRRLKGHRSELTDVALSRDGRVAVSTAYTVVSVLHPDLSLRVWEVESGRLLRTVDVPDRLRDVAVSGDGRLAVSTSADALKVWEVNSGCLLRTITGHTGSINDVALTLDGRLAVSASADNTLKVWEVESGRLLQTLQGHLGEVNGVALSEGGHLAVSTAADETLRVWEVESGRLLQTLQAQNGSFGKVALSEDGRLAASGGKTVSVWDLNRSALIATFTCEDFARCCAFAGSDRIIAGDNSGRLYHLQLVMKPAQPS